MRNFTKFILLIGLLAGGSLNAAVVNFTGGTGDWNVPGNWNTGTMPTAADEVLISTGAVVTIPASYTASILDIEIAGTGSLTVAATGILEINGSADNAIYIRNDATLTIDGTVNIGNTSVVAVNGIEILGNAVVTTNASGVINIDNTASSAAIRLNSDNAVFDNKGTTTIGATTEVIGAGISMGNGTLNNSGMLDVADVTTDGFIIYAAGETSTNSGTIKVGSSGPSNSALGIHRAHTFNNTGTIEIDSTLYYGIYMNNSLAVFNNSGSIKIGGTKNIQRRGVDIRKGTFNNNLGGVIEINRVQSQEVVALGSTTAIFNNNGSLKIGNLAACIPNAIRLNSGSTFLNDVNGSIEVDSLIGNTSGLLIYSTSKFQNKGNFKIGNNNSVKNTGIYVPNSGLFENYPTGSIEVNKIKDNYGIWVTGAGSFENDGSIKIGNIHSLTDDGIYLNSDNATFTNGVSGEIEIDNINGALGFYHERGTVHNYGSIKIGNLMATSITADGYHLRNAAVLNTYSGSLIEVNNVLGDGFEVGHTATVTNAGTIRIGNLGRVNRQGLLLWSSSTFTNDVTGIIESNNVNFQALAVTNANSVFDNYGLIKIGADATPDAIAVQVNTGVFNNKATGSIEIITTGSDGITVNNAASFNNEGSIKMGASNAIPLSGIYLNGTATFNNMIGSSIEIDSITTNYGLYLNSTNANFNNSGSLKIGNNASIRLLGIYLRNGTITNNSDGAIEVNNVRFWDGISVANASVLSNSGSIKVGNVGAISRDGVTTVTPTVSFTNNLGGVIEIDNTGVRGLEINSAFTNSGTINIGQLGEIGNDGILIGPGDSFVNTSTGVITIDSIAGTGANDPIIIHPSGTITQQGEINIGVNSKVARAINYSGGTVTNSGTMRFGDITSWSQHSSQTYTNVNGGIIEVAKNGLLRFNGTINNQAGGTIRVLANGILRPHNVSNLINDGQIILASDADGTGIYDDFTYGGNTFTNNNEFRVERYVTAGSGHGQRYFGSPVSSGAIIGLSSSYTTYPLGQLIPDNCNSNVLDQNSPYSNLLEWHEDATFPTACDKEGWFAISAATNLTPGRAYSGWMYDASTPYIIGDPNTGDISYVTSGVSGNGPVNANGWHLLSNPFPSPLNVASIFSSGFTSPQTYDAGTGPYSGTFNPVILAGENLAIMQGFVAESSTGATFTARQADRNVGASSWKSIDDLFTHLLEINVTGNGFGDRTYLYFSNDNMVTVDFDAYGDCVKNLSNPGQPTLFTKLDTDRMSLNGYPAEEMGPSIRMGLLPGTDGVFEFNFSGMESFPVNITIYLEDKLTSTFHDLADGPYEFSSTTADVEDRFEIHFVLPASFDYIAPTCENVLGTIIENTNDNREVIIFKDGTEMSQEVLDGSENELSAGLYTFEVIDNYGGSQNYVFEVEEIIAVSSNLEVSDLIITEGEELEFISNAIGANTYSWMINGLEIDQTENLIYMFNSPGVFNVDFLASNENCQVEEYKTISVTEKTTTSIHEIGGQQVSVYSSNGNLNIDFGKGFGNEMTTFKIYDMLGKLVLEEEVNAQGLKTIEINDLVLSYYVVNMNLAEERISSTLLLGKK